MNEKEEMRSEEKWLQMSSDRRADEILSEESLEKLPEEQNEEQLLREIWLNLGDDLEAADTATPLPKLSAELFAVSVNAGTPKLVTPIAVPQTSSSGRIVSAVILVCLVMVGFLMVLQTSPEKEVVIEKQIASKTDLPSVVDSLTVLDSGWQIRPIGKPLFRVIDANHVELLRGELDVQLVSQKKKHEEKEPLHISTPMGTATATGTHFFIGTHCHSLKSEFVVATAGSNDRFEQPFDQPVERDQNEFCFSPEGAGVVPNNTEKVFNRRKKIVMKKMNSLTRVLVLAGIVTLSNTFGSVTGTESSLLAAEKGQSPVKAVVKTNSDFAINLYKQLVKENKGTNLFFSPYSVSSALMMTMEGARGKTAQEMGDVLCFPKNAQRLGPGSQQIPWRTGLMHTGMGKMQDEINNEQKYDSPAQQKLLKELRALEKQLAGLTIKSPKEEKELAEKRARDPKLQKEIMRLWVLEGKLQEKSMAIWFKTQKKSPELQKEINDIQAKIKGLTGGTDGQAEVIEGKIYEVQVKLNYYESRTVNSLWGEKTYPFSKNYLKTINGSYKTGGLFLADFKGNSETERLRINKWVEEQTNNRIQDLFSKGAINARARLVLVNAIYFKAAWKTPFQKAKTREMPFTLSNNKTVSVPMMSHPQLNFSAPFYAGKDFKMVEIPYIGRYSMVAIVPNSATGLSALEAKLSSENLSQWISQLKKQPLELLFPKFQLKTSYSLKETLKTMGMPTAFNSLRADFSGLAERTAEPLYISLVKHKAFIDVTEKGTEAAAATGVVMNATGGIRPEKLSVDRPFVYLIRDTKTGSITFMGRMLNPTAK